MSALLEIAKTIGGPGSVGFLLLAYLLIGAASWYQPARRRAGYAALLLCTMYIVMATPVVAAHVGAALPRVSASNQPDGSPLDLLITLGGDNVDGRITETARVYSAAAPRAVLVLGPDWFVERLRRAGIPRASICQIGDPANTRSQMQAVSDTVARNPTGRIGVVASRLQMPRVAALAAAEGILGSHFVLIAAPVDREPTTTGLGRYLPSYAALCVTRDALYEVAALAYYRWRGYVARDFPIGFQSTSAAGVSTQ
jgi:uncharacterized SAM-binding protein YcdF (DUF218 family)